MPLPRKTPDFACNVDLALLQEYVGTDPADLQRFVRLGLDSLTQALAPLPQALATHDMATLQACAHRAKSTARHLGADNFADDCQALETAARQRCDEEALNLGTQVHTLLPQLLQALEQALHPQRPG